MIHQKKKLRLIDTLDYMVSKDYKKRFIAEYLQAKIRKDKLIKMLNKWDEGTLDYVPDCERELYDIQAEAMQKYISCLEARAVKEEIDLTPYL